MGPNSKHINRVTLIVKWQYRVFINVVWRNDSQACEPVSTKFFGNALKGFSRNPRKVSQVSWVDSYANGSVSKVVQGHCHSSKIQQTTSAELKTNIKMNEMQLI